MDLMQLRRGLTYAKSTDVIGELRLRKDETEIELLKKSGEMAERLLSQLVPLLQPGMREKDLVNEIKRLFQAKG